MVTYEKKKNIKIFVIKYESYTLVLYEGKNSDRIKNIKYTKIRLDNLNIYN